MGALFLCIGIRVPGIKTPFSLDYQNCANDGGRDIHNTCANFQHPIPPSKTWQNLTKPNLQKRIWSFSKSTHKQPAVATAPAAQISATLPCRIRPTSVTLCAIWCTTTVTASTIEQKNFSQRFLKKCETNCSLLIIALRRLTARNICR